MELQDIIDKNFVLDKSQFYNKNILKFDDSKENNENCDYPIAYIRCDSSKIDFEKLTILSFDKFNTLDSKKSILCEFKELKI